jgi:signal peptidase I
MISSCATHAPIAADLKLTLAAQILSSEGTLRISPIGNSMLPSIWPGDVLIIERCTPDDIEVGDIIRFMQAGRIVIHRVVAVLRGREQVSWVTRGDALMSEDDVVTASQLLGRVCAIERNQRTIRPSRRLLPLARRVGCMLQEMPAVPGLVLRIRRLLRQFQGSRPQPANT